MGVNFTPGDVIALGQASAVNDPIVDMVQNLLAELLAKGQENERLREENARLREAAYKDSLTGVPNRRSMDEAVASLEFQKSAASDRRKNKGNWIIVIDLDGFKPINDTHGHAAGDRALIEVAQFLRTVLRETDIVARTGGDEFVILLRGANEEAANIKIEHLKKGFETLSFDWQEQRISIGASLGACPLQPSKTFDEILHDADAAMYKAKKAKGNTRYVVSPSSA